MIFNHKYIKSILINHLFLFHISSSTLFVIEIAAPLPRLPTTEDSYLQTGDDAIAVKSGWDCFGPGDPGKKRERHERSDVGH